MRAIHSYECPMCQRVVSADMHRFNEHLDASGARYCQMSRRRTPITGTSDDDYRARATLICELAAQVQDQDPHEVWDYLTTLPAVELQRMLQIALAAIPVEGTVNETFAWVMRLPAARGVA